MKFFLTAFSLLLVTTTALPVTGYGDPPQVSHCGSRDTYEIWVADSTLCSV